MYSNWKINIISCGVHIHDLSLCFPSRGAWAPASFWRTARTTDVRVSDLEEQTPHVSRSCAWISDCIGQFTSPYIYIQFSVSWLGSDFPDEILRCSHCMKSTRFSYLCRTQPRLYLGWLPLLSVGCCSLFHLLYRGKFPDTDGIKARVNLKIFQIQGDRDCPKPKALTISPISLFSRWPYIDRANFYNDPSITCWLTFARHIANLWTASTAFKIRWDWHFQGSPYIVPKLSLHVVSYVM